MPAPRLDTRSVTEISSVVRTLTAGYLAHYGFAPGETDPGGRLIALFSRLMEILIERENRIPEKNFVEFLDMVGVERFPGSPALVPVTFTLAKDARFGGLVDAGTRVATTQTQSFDAQTFQTTIGFHASPSRVLELINLVPGADAYNLPPVGEVPPTPEGLADKGSAVTALSESAGGLLSVEHSIYLESKSLLDQEAAVDLTLIFDLADGAPALLQSANLSWERFDADTKAWVDELEATDLMATDSQVQVRLSNLSGVGKAVVNGEEGYYLAGRLAAGAIASPNLPLLRGVRASAATPTSAAAIAPDAAFANSIALDLSAPFLPFGPRPRYGDVLYLASATAFGPNVATVTLNFTVSGYSDDDLEALFQGGTGTTTFETEIAWQYPDENGSWHTVATLVHRLSVTPGAPVPVDRSTVPAPGSAPLLEGNGAFVGAGDEVRLQLTLPEDRVLREISGVESYWLRAILLTRDPYGSDGFVIPGDAGPPVTPPIYVGPLFFPPTVEALTLEYSLRDQVVPVDRVLTGNALGFHDGYSPTDGPDTFPPFVPVSEQRFGAHVAALAPEPTLYIALDRPLVNAYASLYLHLDEATGEAGVQQENGRSSLVWEYLAADETWLSLDVADGTEDLTTSGTIGFVAPAEPVAAMLFPSLFSEGQAESPPYWLRARLVSGTHDHPPRILGIYLNTVMAENRTTAPTDLLVGSGNGKPNQTLPLVQSRILSGDLWVREPERPSEEELEVQRQEVLADLRLENPDAELDVEDLLDIREQEPRQERAVWVRWRRVPNFLASGPRSRHYTLDAVSGVLGLGDGELGVIPPAGKDNLVLRGLSVGGGETANRLAVPLAVKELKTSLPYVGKVFNLAPASGGADAWSMEDTRDFGPQSIKNRGRAVTTEDYQWMARERFSQIAKARCLATREPGADGVPLFKPGAVTLIVVPKGPENLARPSSALRGAIAAYLRGRALGGIAEEIHVIGPTYRPLSVTAVVHAVSPAESGRVAQRIVLALEQYLHPVTGGEDGQGWEFGRAVHLSKVFALVSKTAGVDFVESAAFVGDDGNAETVAVGENELVASGTHEIQVT